MRRLLLAGLAGVLLLLLLVALLPWLARPLVAGALSVALRRPVSIAALRWDLAGLAVVADDVRIGAPPEVVSVRRVTVVAAARASDWRHVVLRRIAVEAPSGDVALDDVLGGDEGGAAARPPALPVAVSVRELVISDAALTLHPPRGAAQVALVVTRAAASDLALGSGGTLALKGEIDGTVDGAPLGGTVEIHLDADGKRVSGSLRVQHLALRSAALPLPAAIRSLGGTADATATLAIGDPPGRAEVQLDLRVGEVALDTAYGATLRAARVEVPAARIDLAGRRIDLGAVSVRDPVLALDLAAAGPPAAAGPAAAAWSVRSGPVSVRGGEVRLRRGDASTALRLQRLRWDGLREAAVPLSLAASVAGGGTLAVEGRVRIDPLRADLTLRVDALPAPPWTRLLDLPLQLARGAVSGTAQIAYDDGLRSVSGDLQAADVHTLPPDPSRPTEVLAVATASAAFAWVPGDPTTIDVSAAALRYPYAMVVRSDAGTFPYSLLGVGGAGSASAGATPATLRIARMTVESGKLEFVDETLAPPFWTSLTDIAASAEQIAMPSGTVERFTLAGKRDELSPVVIAGTLGDEGLGGRVEVTDVLLDSLNPYIAPRLGYRITAGRLSTVATAHPRPPLLVSAADVVLKGVDVLQTGTDVILEQSGVPLPIALSLIADVGGRIDLRLPFSIDTTSGDVAVGSVLWQAVRKALVAALTSPLRVLGSLFGTGGAPHAFAVDPIPFAAGSATLDAAGRTRVAEIARIVQAHPGLLLVLLPQLTDGDVAAVSAAGAAALARERNAAARDAFLGGGLPPKRLLLAPWAPDKGARATGRPGVYVELQDAG